MDISGYQQIWDCHTHSKYSKDAQDSIEDNVRSAYQKGLKRIAITDHGFNHKYGIKREDVLEMRKEIERLKKIYPIEILLGIEANIISLDGEIDLSKEEQSWFDIIILGVHKSARPNKISAFFNFFLANLIWKTKHHQKMVTNAYIQALKNNKIDIVVHLHNIIRVDAIEVAKEAAKHGTLIEFNNKHMLFSEDEIKEMAKVGANFVIDTDAHRACDVGNPQKVLEFLKTHDVPLERIVNFKKVEQSDGQN